MILGFVAESIRDRNEYSNNSIILIKNLLVVGIIGILLIMINNQPTTTNNCTNTDHNCYL